MHPVLIAGAGPTGLTAALELSRFGIPVRLIDKLPEPRTTSRALGVQARTMELMDQRGLAQEMIARGQAGRAVNLYANGQRAVHLELSRIESRFNFVLILSQAETEQVLTEAIGRQGVQVERGVELVAIGQAGSHERAPGGEAPVRAMLRHGDGRLEQVEASWLISAEGAHSLVRTTLDIPFEGRTLPSAFALGDVAWDAPLSGSELHAFASEHGMMGLFPLADGRIRVVADTDLVPGQERTPPTLAELQRLYDQSSHVPARLSDLTWSSWFRINSRMVARLRAGRILLGGDAAHIHSPMGGQGMNTGIQDMINVCWKLALVENGRAGMELIDTYEQERLPVMRNLLKVTEEATRVIGSGSGLVRGVLTHLGPWVGGAGMVQEAATARVSQLAIEYRGSKLSANHGPGGNLRAGDRLPDLPVRVRAGDGWRETNLHAALDPSCFVLLLVEPVQAPATSDPLLRSVAIQPAADAERFRTVFGRSGGAFLVRPDGYVALACGGHEAARHLDGYLAQWFGCR